MLIIFCYKEIHTQTNEVIILEFKSFYKDGANIGDNYIHNLQERKLYSKLFIGEPEYEIMMILSLSNPFFALIPIHFNNKENNFNTGYYFRESKSFKNETCPQKFYLESKKDIKAKESGGNVDMCKAIQDIRQEGYEQGIEQGIERGIEQGIERGIEQGIERGIEQGIEQGVEQGVERTIVVMINIFRSMGISDDEIISKIVENSTISAEDAERYVRGS